MYLDPLFPSDNSEGLAQRRKCLAMDHSDIHPTL